ncbi:tripartite tricarboxylate transporter TctB family protein [Geomicrobium sp. JCM 19038]|uniref:tripartite tricarboxylate transporter TctB family protein n=1 Tax=Geomicrobium sp. JCM 19038 TaxID=1460635 RepID=UPI00045F4417|nr:tripartite tricarboxylate transporter TctB family protein [Geomicrobium sp. JCM 19038]GAK08485.1 tricarboxylate transport protein TctB [Geomicrobium sp. JCM 19038]
MNAVRLSLPIFFIVVSLALAILTLQLPHAQLGNPYGPMYFPLVVSVGLFLFSVIDLIKTRHHFGKENEDLKALLKKETLFTLGVILALCLLYTIIFERLGFFLSTVIFLVAIMFFLNGKKKWLLNIIVTLVVAGSSWYVFSYLLEISLP